MATKIFNTRTQHSRDTSANWTKYNPVLLDGEIVIVDTDAGEVRYKVGDGTKKYSQLPFSDESIKNSIPTKTSQLENDLEYITIVEATTVLNNYTTKNELNAAVSDKQDAITGAATTITAENLTANRALVSDSTGKVAVSIVTSTELGYIDGVTSNVQSQIDGKVNKSGDTMTGTLTVGSASLQTNGYVTGTWLKTTADTALSSTPTKIAVINDGWVYTRTPAQIKSDIGLSNVDNVKQYSSTNPPPYPVTSVNGKTGAVTVSTTKVVMQSAKPTGLSTGDFWYKIKIS
nr:MAG TPA: hyaluronidase [Caudoviricetes sp.]